MALSWLNEFKESLLHLAFPHVCAGCGSNHVRREHLLCLHCLEALPRTHFHRHHHNPVAKMFWGRLPLVHATAHLYFTKDSLVQHLMHQVKYKGHKELGFYLGSLLGHDLLEAGHFTGIDALVPLPLHAAKQHKRGYNQATLLCEGISSVLQKPVLKDAVARTTHTESQTKKNRVERWQNMEGRFELRDEAALSGKHLLLVDDIVTTGATLEACGRALLQAPNAQVSLATLCISSS